MANAAIVPAGTNGEISIFVTDAADVVIDINGYFSSSATLQFYPVSPRRISDTRNANGSFGGPVIGGTQSRQYAVPSSGCGITSGATAFVLNATVVPSGSLAYLTVWPTGSVRPLVSTLNAFDGSVTSNAVIVPANAGSISTFVTDTTHLILDASGYFAP